MSERTTGTRDEHYNVISVLYHTLQGAETCGTYLQDAEQAGDQRVELFGWSEVLVPLLDYQLPFLDHVHELHTGEGILGKHGQDVLGHRHFWWRDGVPGAV